MLHVTEVTPISLGYLTLGGFVVAFSMISLLVKEKLYMGEVVLGTAFGVIIGPHCAGIFDPREWGSTRELQNNITLEVMRVVLATGLFAIGVELPKAYLAEHARSLLAMVVPTMAFGWVISAGIIVALFPSLSFISALVISACLTPTDPILAAAIIGGKFAIKNVPGHIRRLLSAESAANDGLAYPFLSISLYLTLETSRRAAVGKWFLVGWLYQVIFGTVLGAVLGLTFSHLMRISHRKGLIDRESFVAQYLALAILTIGIASTLGTDDLLAAFAAGSAISWDGHFNTYTEDEMFSSIIDLVLNCACFIYIGAWLPFDQFHASELGLEPWKLVVLFLAILVLRRIPSLLLLYKFIPDIHDWREALFCGHFGPMGVGAVFISTLALTRLPEPSNPPADQSEYLAATLQPIVSFVVLCSILIHGLSIPAFWFGRKVHTRTLSLTRTLTSRSGLDRHAPEWLYSTRRAPVHSATASPPPESQTPGELESAENTVIAGESAKSTARFIESRKSRPGTPRLDSRAGSQVAFALDLEGGRRNTSVPGTPSPVSPNAEMRECAAGGDARAVIHEGQLTQPEERDLGVYDGAVTEVDPEDEESHVRIKNEEGETEIVGYGFASLHDEQENDRNVSRESEAEAQEDAEPNAGTPNASVTKHIKFVE